jgi:hypothetical protein
VRTLERTVRARSLALLTCLPFVAGCGDTPRTELSAARQAPSPTATATPDPVAPPKPAGRYETVDVLSRTWLRTRPNGRKLKLVSQQTEFRGRTVFSVISRNGQWIEILTPAVRNGRTAWIHASRVTEGSTNFSIHVDRSARRAELRLKDETVLRFRVAIGKPGNETPTGRFAVTDKIDFSKVSTPYGCCALALTGHQHKIDTGWRGGDRLAIHGTPVEASVGKAVSLGCLRARRQDLRVLMRRVPLGTPVFIRA